MKHSLCNPEPQPTQQEAEKRRGQKNIESIPFLNPDPVAELVGRANEAPVVMDGCKVTALVDSGAQVSTISAKLCEELDLEIQPLGQLLELEGTGVQPSLTSGSWRLTSKFPGYEDTMRMCCCWPSPPRPTPKEFQLWWALK